MSTFATLITERMKLTISRGEITVDGQMGIGCTKVGLRGLSSAQSGQEGNWICVSGFGKSNQLAESVWDFVVGSF